MPKFIVNICILIFCVLTLNPALAEETIKSYHSDILVLENADMLVTETIVVRSEQNRIRHGIYRDFPLNYKDLAGNRYKVGFKILEIRRNDQLEKYHTQEIDQGIRIYIGRQDVILPPGIHKFEISYKTDRQLGYFKHYDELYWNVTGNAWDFPILQASATVSLPAKIPAGSMALDGFTGNYGSTAKNFAGHIDAGGIVHFDTSKRLEQRQGFSIVVNWPKGYFIEPDLKTRILFVLMDNLGICVGLGGIAVLLLYYLLVWSRIGKDPQRGIIFPHYEPPEGYSPASIRFIREMGYDKTCFTTALINLAVKGHLSITENRDKQYTLTKLGDSNQPLAPGEAKLLNKLFGSADTIVLEQENHAIISAAIDAHQDSLEKDYEKIYFKTNAGYFYFGFALTLLFLVASVVLQNTGASMMPVLFMMVWLSIWSIVVLSLITQAWHGWKRAMSGFGFASALGATVLALPFLAAEIAVLVMMATESSWLYPAMIIAFVAINWLFYELLKAPTLAGRKLLDKIDGFKRFIEIADKHELEFKYTGGKTPELFERILPYAIALGLEQQWSRQFENQLRASSAASGSSYSPHWYHGSSWDSHQFSNFSSSLSNSLTTSVASSSTTPGSSSGSGGGGFSGGGGGGGGGGGW